MKKALSKITMLAMMVAALSFSACGGDNDDDEGGSGEKSLMIDGDAYYSEGTLSENYSRGIHLVVDAFTDNTMVIPK